MRLPRCKTFFPLGKPREGHRRDLCWACQTECKITVHHVIPRRLHIGGKLALVGLCQSCHHEVEKILTEAENEILRQHLDIYREALVELQCQVRNEPHLVSPH